MIMEHKGTKRLETERLILRPFTAEDGPAMYKNWTGDPEVTRFLTWPTHPSADVSAQLAAFWAEEAGKPDHYQWAVVLKDLNEPVGSLAVVSHWDDVAKCELGYCLGRAWWGRGLMTEAVKEVIRYLFREVGMNRIDAEVTRDLSGTDDEVITKTTYTDKILDLLEDGVTYYVRVAALSTNTSGRYNFSESFQLDM